MLEVFCSPIHLGRVASSTGEFVQVVFWKIIMHDLRILLVTFQQPTQIGWLAPCAEGQTQSGYLRVS